MAIETGIEYADSTCNPTPGCAGCELYDPDPARNHCWAAVLIRRYAGCKGWPRSFTEPEYFPGRVEKAVRWPDLTGRKRPGRPWLNGLPRVVFLNDLGDTFAPNAPDPEGWLLPLVPAMAASPHVWLFFTKWPRRMHRFFTAHEPPPNFWGLVSVTDQKTADARIPWLLKTPFSVRGVSAEPPLEMVDLHDWLICWACGGTGCGIGESDCPGCEGTGYDTLLDWLIVGTESGSNARPWDWGWLRDLRDQAQAAGVPFFLKQITVNGRKIHTPELDGRTWTEMPEVKR